MITMPEITLILHNIRSTHNVGAIFRTAEGFGVKEIILSGYTPYPKIPSDQRLPHISENLVPFQYIESIYEWIASSDLPVVALEQSEHSTLLQNFTAPDKFALVLGEEVHGVEDEIIKKCSAIVEIPMLGQKESFNVSVACGIALYGMLF